MRMRPGTLVTWLDGTTRAYGWISQVVDERSFVILASGLLRVVVPNQQLRPSRADRYLPVGMRIQLQGEAGFGTVVGQCSSYDMMNDNARYVYEVLRDTPLPLDDQQRAEAHNVGGRVADPTIYISGSTSPYTRGHTAPVMARHTLAVGQEVLLRHPSAGLPLGMRGVLTDIRNMGPRYGVLSSTWVVRWITQPRNIGIFNRSVSSSISSVFLVRTEDASEFAQLRNVALENAYGTVKVNRRSSFKVFIQQLERKAPLNTR